MDAINHRKESRIVKLRANKRVIIAKRFVLLLITALAISMPIELIARASAETEGGEGWTQCEELMKERRKQPAKRSRTFRC